jgi:uncharacterized protein
MFSRISRFRFSFGLAIAFGLSAYAEAAPACVWKVTEANGGTLFLGGSVHALKSTDYPLPAEYNRAFDLSTRVAFEVDPKEMGGIGKSLLKAGEYPRGDSLKNHVDPRSYDYLRHFFRILNIPEEKFARFRAWYLAAMLQAPQLHGLSSGLGVEEFLVRRARVNSKPMSGLESLRDSVEIFSGLTDRQGEAMLLLSFIPAEQGSSDTRLMQAWRQGDADTMTQMTLYGFRDFPSLGKRLLDARNRNWVPKLEAYLRSGQTYFVVVGAAHLGGPDGLVALLRARGCKLEQL